MLDMAAQAAIFVLVFVELGAKKQKTPPGSPGGVLLTAIT
jgi:hypothetical protein